MKQPTAEADRLLRVEGRVPDRDLVSGDCDHPSPVGSEPNVGVSRLALPTTFFPRFEVVDADGPLARPGEGPPVWRERHAMIVVLRVADDASAAGAEVPQADAGVVPARGQ